MALFTFEKDEGKKLFSHTTASAGHPLSAAETAALNDAAANAILLYLGTSHFPVTGLSVTYDIASATAVVKGLALDQATRKKIVECCGSIQGVQHVDDHMGVASAVYEAAEAANNGDLDFDEALPDADQTVLGDIGHPHLGRTGMPSQP